MRGVPGARQPDCKSTNRSGGTATLIVSRACVCRSRQVAAGNATQAQPVHRLRLHVRAKHGVHAAQVSPALLPKPLEHVAVYTKVYGSFARARHDHVSVLPKIRVNLADRGVGVGTRARLAAGP